MKRRDLLRSIFGAGLAAVLVPVARLFPRKSELVHVPSESAFAESLAANFKEQQAKVNALFDDMALVSTRPMILPPKLVEFTYACGHTDTLHSPGMCDPAAIYYHLPMCPDGIIRVQDIVLVCPECKRSNGGMA